MKNQLLLFILLIAFGCTKDEIDNNNLLYKNTDKNYPTSFKKLSLNEIEKRQNEFEADQVTFSLIDSFGFVGWSYEDDFEIRKQLHSSLFANVDNLTKQVKQYMLKKGKFTGVTDISQLVPHEIKAGFYDFGGDIIREDSTKFNHLGLNFGRQEVNGIEVLNSLLTVSATANGVHRIFGHWYPEVYIPETDQVSVELAKSVLIGRKLTSYNGWGKEFTYFIAEEELAQYRKVIFSFINDNRLELRICWEFLPAHFRILIDTTTGEILAKDDMSIYLF